MTIWPIVIWSDGIWKVVVASNTQWNMKKNNFKKLIQNTVKDGIKGVRYATEGPRWWLSC
jgi:hypothetical protein